jgi:hypothetical protein
MSTEIERGPRSGPKRRLGRRSVERTRALMIDAAVNVLTRSLEDTTDAALAVAVANIKVPDVVAEATRIEVASQGASIDEYHPMTIGALYQIWPTQSDFQADVVLHIASLDTEVVPTMETTAAMIERGITGHELLRHTLTEAWQFTRDHRVFRILLACYTRAANPSIRAALSHSHLSFVTKVNDAWLTTLTASGLRPRPPYTIAHIARATAAVIEGFTLQWIADPEALRDPFGANDWDLAVRTAVAIAESFTEPI